MNTSEAYRIERDSIGEKAVPKDALYGIQSLRAYENFRISGLHVPDEMIISIAQIKKACAITNHDICRLNKERTDAIVEACDRIIEGQYFDQFIVDPIQGGAGTSFNMNANEVIANVANIILGGKPGDYHLVHPNDHVNFAQSTNDVYPSCGKITALKLLYRAQDELKRLYSALIQKAQEFDHITKMGRTEMQDAVPIRLGQEFKAYATAIARDVKRFEKAKNEMRYLNMGGTAIGTGLNADIEFLQLIIPVISEVVGLEFRHPEDLIDATQNLDTYASVSGITKSCAVNLSKIANDLRLMSSGPRCGLSEINLPAKQNGSSIMPGKINPVVPEVVSQIAYNIIGNDVTITMAAEAGQLELNHCEPVIFYNLFHSIEQTEHVVTTFIDNCISGITANEERCQEMVENSVGTITAITPYVGYTKAAEIAHVALETGEPVRSIILREGLLSKEDLDVIFDAHQLTEPGIPGISQIGADCLCKKNR